MEVVWSEEAKQSLQNIYDAIFKDSPQNANHVVESLLDLGSSLKNPKIEYAKEPIINKKRFRFIPKWSYKIIYERANNKVVILDVFNSKQHPNKMNWIK
jgi:plasmid stabilization system protein ParE